MLTHLASSIERFGPPSLSTTETFEGYNGVTRNASVHSNRQAPGRDIANSYNNERLLKILLSGGSFVDSKLGMRATASAKLCDLFRHGEIRKGLGLHLQREDDLVWKTKRTSIPLFFIFLSYSLLTYLTPDYSTFHSGIAGPSAGPPDAPPTLLTCRPGRTWFKCLVSFKSKTLRLTPGVFLLVRPSSIALAITRCSINFFGLVIGELPGSR